MKASKRQIISYLLLLLLVLLMTVSSHPTIVDMSRRAGMESGTILSRYITVVFALLFISCINLKSMLKPYQVRVFLFIFIAICWFFFLSWAVFGKRTMMTDVRSIAICIASVMIGWEMNLDKKKFSYLVLAFSLLTLYAGLMQVFRNIGGFRISSQYLADNKNSLGVMLSTGVIALFLMGLNRKEKDWIRIALWGLMLVSFFVIVTIRARAAMLVCVVLILYVIYERYKVRRDFVLYIILGLFLLSLAVFFLPSSIKEYIIDSLFKNREFDFTAGRMARNRAGINFVSQHVWVGNLNIGANLEWIHNYPLNKLYEFGVIFSFPIILLYLFVVFYTCKKTIECDQTSNYSIGYYAMLLPIVISMAEPTFPFGPGTATVFNFILLGCSIRDEYLHSQIG